MSIKAHLFPLQGPIIATVEGEKKLFILLKHQEKSADVFQWCIFSITVLFFK